VRQRRLPQQPAGALVERAEPRVLRRGDENQATARHDRATVLLRAGDRYARAVSAGELAERNTPAVFAAVEIDGAQRAPRRLDRGIAARVSPALVADELVGERTTSSACQLNPAAGYPGIRSAHASRLRASPRTRHEPTTRSMTPEAAPPTSSHAGRERGRAVSARLVGTMAARTRGGVHGAPARGAAVLGVSVADARIAAIHARRSR